MKTKKPEFEPDKYYILKPQFRLLGKFCKEFMDKIKKHKYYHHIWWSSEELTNTPEQLTSYWNSLFGTPHLLEWEFIEELINEYGIGKAKQIIRQFKEDNFHVVKTMRAALNKDGTIKSRDSEQTGRRIDTDWKKTIRDAGAKIEKEGTIKPGDLTKGLK